MSSFYRCLPCIYGYILLGVLNLVHQYMRLYQPPSATAIWINVS